MTSLFINKTLVISSTVYMKYTSITLTCLSGCTTQNGKQKNANENKTCVRWIITGCRKPNWKCCFKISLSESVRILLYYSHVYEFLNKEIRNHLQLLKGLEIITIRTVQDNSIPTRKNMHGRNNIGGFLTYKFLLIYLCIGVPIPIIL